MSAITPPATQTATNQVTLGTLEATIAGILKIPAPMIVPTIIQTQSKSVSTREVADEELLDSVGSVEEFNSFP